MFAWPKLILGSVLRLFRFHTFERCPSPKFLRAIKSMRYEDRPGDWIDVICPSFCPALHHGPVLAVAFLTHSGLLGNFDLSVSELLGFATVVDSD
jgi:hypothetical protein